MIAALPLSAVILAGDPPAPSPPAARVSVPATSRAAQAASPSPTPARETIALGGGCFWCTEAVFEELKGVDRVEAGYSGGTVPNPTYEQVSTGETGHAETSEITFDPKVISLHDLLDVFFTVHDPTTLDRQGNDEGTQYRSVIFYRDARQKAIAEQVIREIAQKRVWRDKIVTEVVPFKAFYKAEDYHQEYFKRNGEQPYCQFVIAPKVAKFRRHFLSRLKTQ